MTPQTPKRTAGRPRLYAQAANERGDEYKVDLPPMRASTRALLKQEAARLVRLTGQAWTYEDLLRALLLHWQVRPPAALPTTEELYPLSGELRITNGELRGGALEARGTR